MRGRKPRKSIDPREQRQVIVRMTGALHKTTLESAKNINSSINQFILAAIREKIERDPTTDIKP